MWIFLKNNRLNEYTGMADADCLSECASSVGDEERVKRLFQACDANGDGYIDR